MAKKKATTKKGSKKKVDAKKLPGLLPLISKGLPPDDIDVERGWTMEGQVVTEHYTSGDILFTHFRDENTPVCSLRVYGLPKKLSKRATEEARVVAYLDMLVVLGTMFPPDFSTPFPLVDNNGKPVGLDRDE